MRPGDIFGIYIAIYVVAIQEITAKPCRTKVFSFQRFKNSGIPTKATPAVKKQRMSSVSDEKSVKNCLDENPDTFCMTKDEENPFFVIEYREPAKITQVRITVRKDCCWEQAKEMLVIVTDKKPVRGRLALSSGTQLGSTYEGPATKAGQVITFKSTSGVTGKYVIVQQQYKGIMNLAEVAVNPGVVTMSSELTYPAENCIDGNVESFCQTETEKYPYFMIEYPVPIKVKDVKLTIRKNCCWDKVKQLAVIVTDTKPSKGKSVLATGSQLGSTFIGPATSGGQVISFNSTRDVKGKYVVIQQQYEGPMNLAEIEVNTEYERELYRKMMNKDYKKCLKNTACKGCYNVIDNYLPELLQADMIREGEIPVFGRNKGDYGKKELKKSPWAYTVSLLEGDDIITRKVDNELVTINGTIVYWIGKRQYVQNKRRPTGLYVAPGDIVTITFPQEVVGKIRIFLGHWKYQAQVQVKQSVQKFGSPYGGLLLVWMNYYNGDHSTFRGEFTIKVDGAIKAPMYTYGENTNEQWNKEIKHYSPKWAILRIPGQLVIYVQTLYIRTITDIEASMTRIKKMIDSLQELVGIPAGSRPGEDSMMFIGFPGGVRAGICQAGTAFLGDDVYTEDQDTYTSYYDDFFKKYGTNGLVGHEMGHGFCMQDILPAYEHWTAEFIAAYARKKTGRKGLSIAATPDLDFPALGYMVKYKLYSKGKGPYFGCQKAGEVKQIKRTCWFYLHLLPQKAYSWNVIKDVFTLYTRSTKYQAPPSLAHYVIGTAYTDKLVDLYCQATKHNMLPFFNLWNIQPGDEEITNTCEKLPESDIITKWLNIVECVKQNMVDGNKDIRDCAKMPLFPKYKGLCIVSGVCHNDENNNGETTIMKNKFDLDQPTSSEKKENCFKRASDYFKDCKNTMDQPITATFYGKELDDGFNHTFPGQ